MKFLFPLSPYNQQRQFEKPVWVYPAHLAMYATYLRDKGNDVIWNPKECNDPSDWKKGIVIYKDDYIDTQFEELPYPDRVFTDAKNPRWQSYGNYRWHPATHMMASNLCWYGKCTFCVDTKKLQEGEHRGLRSVDHVIEEIDNLIHLGFKEVFDDSGTFPVGDWLNEFCLKMRINGRNKKIKIGCNMKPVNIDYDMMYHAGFRFMLFGIESANQYTLDRIKKGGKAKDTIKIMKKASDAGILPHTTWMCGYPWESEEDEKRTIELCHYLLKKGYSKTAQASVYSPPRTQPDPSSKGNEILPKFYDVYRSPEFIFRKLRDIRCWEDITYLLRGARLVLEEKLRKEQR